MAKYTQSEIDEKLLLKNIICVDEYTGMNNKMTFQCILDNYQWNTTAGSIIHCGRNCPKCSNRAKITDDIIDARLIGRDIIRIGNSSGSLKPILFECTLHGEQWMASPNNVLNNNSKNCPKCNKTTKLTNKIIDFKLKDRGITRLEDCKGSTVKILFRCDKDGYEWKTMPYILIEGYGCPKCSGTARITNETIDEKISGKGIIRLGDSTGSTEKILFKCQECMHEWYTTSRTIYKSGCPICKYTNEKRTLDYLKTLYGTSEVHYHKTIKTIKRKFIIDFVVNDIFIEYNGGQHYKSIEYFGGETKFIEQQKRDQDLRDYCNEHNIRLIEIPFWLSHEEQYKLINNLI